ncbi:hypothetical protein C789_5290 [Microcystis aeruginosa FACHB-905 = DIANCHI905]|uniref:Uncharacterized protein n=1 Tax=Microcystis aeruginosa PCC 7806SL TaxID=1903187 RepID=A0AB33BUV3_MICA7|nr:hypothetical protein BH695_2744 [Microcystis aeruginosa PCC 7806SL]ELS44918.1 hypothetical protein C789_5290 [Microcystis aeruginosa FACHB-905 = DIANCHI905]
MGSGVAIVVGSDLLGSDLLGSGLEGTSEDVVVVLFLLIVSLDV